MACQILSGDEKPCDNFLHMALLNRKIAGSYFSNHKKIESKKNKPQILADLRGQKKSAANVLIYLRNKSPIACFITCPAT